jgi:hypothetical protein
MHFDWNLASVQVDGREFAHAFLAQFLRDSLSAKMGKPLHAMRLSEGLPPAGTRPYSARIEFLAVSLP